MCLLIKTFFTAAHTQCFHTLQIVLQTMYIFPFHHLLEISWCPLPSRALKSSCLKQRRPSLKSLRFWSTHSDCSCLVWKFSNSDTCAKEQPDNLRTLFMHFISINVLLAQDQKDGGNLNFLMKVISGSFIPILRVIRLCTIRDWTWELCRWRQMSYPERKRETSR